MNTEFKEKITDEIIEKIAEELILSNFQDVMSGHADEDSIRYFINESAHKVLHSNITPTILKTKLAEILSKISVGEDANKAFGLKKGSRNLNDNGSERTIALQVWQLINRGNFPTEKAIEYIAFHEHRSEETIKKIFYRHKKVIDEIFQNIIAP